MNIIKAEMRNMEIKAKNLRKSGFTPASISGVSLEQPLSIQFCTRDVIKLLRAKGEGARIKIELEGKNIMALIKEIARNPVKDYVYDICFQAIQTDSIVRTKSIITLINTDKTVGFVEQDIYDIPYTAQAIHMVEEIIIDIDGMQPEDRVFVRDLDIAKNEDIELLIDPDAIVFSIREKKRAVLETEEGTAEEEVPVS